MAIRTRKKQPQAVRVEERISPDNLLELAKSKGITTTPIDLMGLCRLLGITIKYATIDNNLSGSLKYHLGRWIIEVNSLHHERRQRFTIAHELAHYCLHRDHQSAFDDSTFHRGKEYTSQEREADNFAGAILMPKSEFRHFISTQSNKIDDIAEYFGASGIAVKIRADVIRERRYEH